MISRPVFVGALLASQVNAFGDLDIGSLLGDITGALGVDNGSNKPATFDAKAQLIDVSGDHAYQAPGPNDQRGPCPGLNVLANHNYLPRSGFADILTFTHATNEVFNMGTDLGGILAVYGAVFDGLLAGWSIGGQEHTGIGGSHNNYETDSSPFRGDLNQYGSNVDLQMSQFKQLYDMQPDAATANYDLSVLKAFRKKRFEESIAKNPLFMYAPFSGAVVSQAAFAFIYRYFANHTAEQPEGVLNKEVLKSFLGISGPEDNLKWTHGTERIPENWYKRSNAYGLQSLGADSATLAEGQSEISQPGCNRGQVNTFTPVNISDLTNDAYPDNAPLTNPLCFGLAIANTAATEAIPTVNFVVQELLLPVQNLLGCVTVPSLNTTVYDACPGYSLYGGPTGQIASGVVSP